MNPIRKNNYFLKDDLENEIDKLSTRYLVHNHAGGIIESIIRKHGHNISKLASYLHVSRCTLYNWFKQDSVSFDILVKIGAYIKYDFSADFPEIFNLYESPTFDKYSKQNQAVEHDDVDHWMRKYIVLLEKYNEYLLHKDDSKQIK